MVASSVRRGVRPCPTDLAATLQTQLARAVCDRPLTLYLAGARRWRMNEIDQAAHGDAIEPDQLPVAIVKYLVAHEGRDLDTVTAFYPPMPR